MNIISFKKLNSTNAYAKENIETLADKTVISTDVQTSGYGRFDRVWVDLGEENIYMTFVLKPSETLREVHANLTQYLSVCLCEVIEDTFKHLNPKIKWPNDVLINGKKVCGILAESVIKGGKLKGIVLGIGVNLNASLDHLNEIDRPATSLNLEIGQNIDKKEFMQKLITQFFINYDDFLNSGFEMIKKDYESRTILTLGERVNVAIFKSKKSGEFQGFDNNGNLLLRTESEDLEHINMGELVS